MAGAPRERGEAAGAPAKKRHKQEERGRTRDPRWGVLWSRLLAAGWREEKGARPRDLFFLPPGVQRGQQGIRLRRDYFDSQSQVWEYVQAQEALAGAGSVSTASISTASAPVPTPAPAPFEAPVPAPALAAQDPELATTSSRNDVSASMPVVGDNFEPKVYESFVPHFAF
eukprot:COSAG04_NODE_11929_length_680_cov_0.975904_1_plen_170_part_00